MSIVVGLDIGTTKIVCFAGIKNEFGKIEIIAKGQADSLGVSRGVVANIDMTVGSIRKAVSAAQEQLDSRNYKINEVYVGIAGQHIKSSQHRGMVTRTNVDTEISQQDINTLIEDMFRLAVSPGEEIIHILPQEYFIDGMKSEVDPIGSPGIRLEANFHVITGQVNACKNIARCISLSGLTMKDMILEPLASAAAVLSDDEKEGGVCLVDIGGGTTDIAIFVDGQISHTAVIPLAGNIITNDIKEGCSILRAHAEKLKIQFGSALANEAKENEIVCIPSFKGHEPKEISIKNLAHIIQARMEEIIDCVNYEIRKSGLEKRLHAGIVLTGGGAWLKHVKQLCEYVTGIDTRIGYPTEHLASTNTIENISSPIYATGIGLVLKGFESASSEEYIINDMNDVQAEKEITEDTKQEEPVAKERKETIRGHSKGMIKSGFLNRMKEGIEGIGKSFGGLFEDEN
jgi:cell division protein FtsA